MMELMKASGATAVRNMGTADGTFVRAETPMGPIDVGFADCAEGPNPCGYILTKPYSISR